MQHHGDYPPNPTTGFHHHHHQQQPPPYASAPHFTPTTYHPQLPPPPPPPYHCPILPTAPSSNRNPINISTITNNISSSYDDHDHLNFPPPPPQKWLLPKKHDVLGMSSGDGGTWKEEEVVFDPAAAPKVDVEEGGAQQFRVKWLAESGWQSTIDVLCQVKEMAERSGPVDTSKVIEQSTEKKDGSGDEMNIIKPPNEEKHQWVLYEAATKCSGCGGDVSAFNRKRHCRQCGDMFCDNCTRGRIALTSKDNAPQVRGDIKCRCDNERRHSHNRLRYAQGQSKSAVKRRARKLGRCFKCGNFSHDGACPENCDNEFRKLFFHGPIRCYTQRLLHPRGYAHARMITELDRLSEKAKRIGL